MQLTPKIRAFLEEPRFAVLATVSPDGMPQQTVIWYELQGGEIMMNTSVGRVKARNLERDPRISFCIEDGYRYLTITGRARLSYDQTAALADIVALARRYVPASEVDSWIKRFENQQRITIRLPIETLVTNGFDQ